MEKWKEMLRQKKPMVLLALLLMLGIGMTALSYLTPQRAVEAAAEANGQTQEEQRLCAILSQISGAGEVDVLVTENEGGTLGVVVVCDGGNDVTVKSDMIQAVRAATGIGAESIEVFGRKE